jgi:cobyrinic acid a,c-diamide synthase
VLAPAGTRVRGHEFHRTTAEPGAGAHPAWHLTGSPGSTRPEGFAQGGVHASYLHLNWAGSPQLAARLVASCTTARHIEGTEHARAHR